MALRGAIFSLGGAARRAGVALEAAGCSLQGSYAYTERLSRHRNVLPLKSGAPPPDAAFIAPTASVLGAVTATPSASVWYGATVRGDVAPVSLGERSAVMDGALVGGGSSVGDGAVVGAGSVLGDGAVLGVGAVVGRGAVLGEGVVVEENGVVDAGAVVPPNTTVQSGTRHSGAPAVLSGSVPAADVDAAASTAKETVTLATAHAAENAKSGAQVRAEARLTELRSERSEDYLAHMGLLGKRDEVAAKQAEWYEREERELAEAGRRK